MLFAAQGRGQNLESTVQALIKGGIEAAPQNFAGTRGTARGNMEDGYLAYDCSSNFLAATGGGALKSLAIEHIQARGDDGDLWRLVFTVGVSADWSRDDVLARIQKLLGPVIPPGFVYEGIDPNDGGYEGPDGIAFGWKGPDNVFIKVESAVDDHGRFIAFTTSHQLPK